MKVVLTYETAIRYWRTHSLDSTSPSRAVSLADVAKNRADIESLCPKHLLSEGTSLRILVEGQTAKSNSSIHRTIAWSGELPPNSLRKISDGVFLSSPEMCFLQFCAHNTLARCVLLGMEMCGSYAVGSDGHACLYDREKLTNPSRLRAFLDECDNHKGVKRARTALGHIVPNAASPMETVVTLLLCMPLKYGGYGLPRPQMNHGVDLGRSSSLAGKRSYRCDLFWPEQQVALEYNSIEYHAEVEAMERDYKRANVLTSMGHTVIAVTWPMVKNEQAFDDLSRLLAKTLRVRTRPETRHIRFKQERSRLRHEVMTPIVL